MPLQPSPPLPLALLPTGVFKETCPRYLLLFVSLSPEPSHTNSLPLHISLVFTKKHYPLSSSIWLFAHWRKAVGTVADHSSKAERNSRGSSGMSFLAPYTNAMRLGQGYLSSSPSTLTNRNLLTVRQIQLIHPRNLH